MTATGGALLFTGTAIALIDMAMYGASDSDWAPYGLVLAITGAVLYGLGS